MTQKYAVFFFGLVLAIMSMPLASQTVQQNLPVTNDIVKAVLFDSTSNLIYIGGRFTYVGPNTGRGVGIDSSTGNTISGFPYVNGNILAVISDRSGGWYISGDFTSVGGVVRNYIAHINADKSVDSWNPNADNSVRALVMSPDGSTIYAGGYFTIIGGQTRNRIAALDASTGNAKSWNPNADNAVWALALAGSNVYAGGIFTTMGVQTRNRIAAIDTSTGSVASWNPDANWYVIALAVSPDSTTIYAGGYFISMGGQTRNKIAAINASTGSITNWNPDANGNVIALATSGSTVYVGGEFSTIGGQTRNCIAALDANTNTNNATSWNPNANNSVNALALSGSTMYAGGGFTTVGGQTRNCIAAIDTSTGSATSWDPNAGGSVNALAVSDSTVYAGGNFISVGGQTRNRLAAINASTGALTSWNPDMNSRVDALVLSGSILYAGGRFTALAGGTVGRNYVAAIETSTGNATSWNPEANGDVYALAISGSTVYVGGDFAVSYSSPSIGGEDRNYIAAIDASTGAATSWDPNANGIVYALAISGSTVYAGGDFNVLSGSPSIGDSDRNYIAAIDASTGIATGWDPNANGGVNALTISGSTVYAGGDFNVLSGSPTIGGADRNYIAALDASTGSATSWNPDANSPAHAFAFSTSNEKVYIGGGFSSIGGTNIYHFAAMDNPWDSALPVELVSFTALPKQNGIELRWETATEVNNYGFEIERRNISLFSSSYPDGFISIGFVEGNGVTSTPKEYSYMDVNLSPLNYSYRLKQIDRNGQFHYSTEVTIAMDRPLKYYSLSNNFPNPFNPSTIIRYSLPFSSRVRLSIHDILGREISILVNEEQVAGWKEVEWNADAMPGGVYFYQLRVNNFNDVKKMLLMK